MAYPFKTVGITISNGRASGIPQRTPYDIVKLGDYEIPGISEVLVESRRKIQVESARQAHGARIVDSGLDLSRVTITTKYFTEEDHTNMDKLIEEFRTKLGIKTPQNTNKVDGFTIIHPDTQSHNIQYVYIESIEGPRHVMPPGYSMITFKCLETRPVRKSNANTVKEGNSNISLSRTPSAVDVNKPLKPSQDPKYLLPPARP